MDKKEQIKKYRRLLFDTKIKIKNEKVPSRYRALKMLIEVLEKKIDEGNMELHIV